ncbi:MAG TPA: TerC family protein [Pirellulales bacterium]|nr:TerC family protein [Pirellulales bacterium]
MPEIFSAHRFAIGLFAQAANPVEVVTPDLTVWHWLAFGLFVVVLLVLDLFIFHRDSREPTLRESAVWTLVWCAVAMAFNGLIWAWRGPEHAILFLTGYVVEWTLSMDNVFVFAVIFNYFAVPLKYQYRVLFWGIIGAIVMRLTFILLGAALLAKFAWILPIFGLLLIYSGIKLAVHGDSDYNPEKDLTMRLAKRIFHVAKEDHKERFFVVENGLRCITPLFLVLLVIDSADLVFAIDSVPAIFGVTLDPFTIFTSNICAILGLRALYFLLAGAMGMFRYLNYGLCAVLIFVGVKMVAEYWLLTPDDVAKGHHLVHPAVSLLVIASLLAISILASILIKHPAPDQDEKSG